MTMAVKFKVGFTMSAETLFSIIAKMLPIEDLQVEEVQPRALHAAPKVAALAAPTKKPRKPYPKNAFRGNRHTGPNLDAGVNAIVMAHLADGKPHPAIELKPLIKAAGFSATGVGSRLQALKTAGIVHQPAFGLWQIVGEARKAASA
jgi:hypothetical protein